MIRLLPPEVADAIAAGEVVERPASVVKELIENSLDAHATRITIEIRGAGRNLLRVVDDGAGIAAADLALAFRRHATSKVGQLRDLEAITTLGFRGEALASIAAVGDVEAQSGGHRLRIRAGEVIEEGSAGPAAGTSIAVRDLFANTPARLHFLKSDATETAACLRVAQSYALLYPEHRFRVVVDGRRTLDSPGDGRLESALAAVHGLAVAREMLVLTGDGVRGAVSPPKVSRGNRDGVLLAVNRRPVVSRPLAYAIEECYRGSLERGRYPVAVVDASVDPELIDVNVHPAKREVRFRNEGAVFAALQRAVLAALSAARPRTLQPVVAGDTATAAPHPLRLELREAPPRLLSAPATGALLRPIGQVLDGYLVAEGPDGVVLIDQHAAHERILFNRFRSRLNGSPAPIQPLLLPLVVDLDPAGVATLGEHRAELVALGFEVEDFGPRSIRVLSGPVETPPARLEQALRDLLAGLARRRLDDGLASLACHSAVRFGDALDPAEQRRLVEELEATTPDATCPHGRPTRLVLEWQELKRHFRRNY